jgi:hypothetical protein
LTPDARPSKRSRDNPAKHFLFAFAIALILYVIAYGWIQHRRTRKGPWQVDFISTNGAPALTINQPWLGLTNVTLVFQGEPAPTNVTHVEFRIPQPTPFQVSFADCIFEDLTFLPGTVTFKACHHEIELLPRVLVIDRKENQWRSGAVVNVDAVNGRD